MKKYLVFILLFGGQVHASWLVKQRRDVDRLEVLSVEKSATVIREEKIILRSIPWFLDEGPKSTSLRYEEILYRDSESLPEVYESFKERSYFNILEQPEGAELRELVIQGPFKNRINLTIIGDGYTQEEKEKFFEDAKRTTQSLFGAKAFSSYLPLFNVYAVFVPSEDSGITDLEPKNTAFGLYRDPPGSKRAIMPGKPSAMEAAIKVAPATDYPIVIANDDYYGGLGGRYAISTRSLQSGPMVLRHELGHNFGSVGEEYDGGFVYQGANFSRSAKVSWSKWVDESFKVFETKFLSGSYVWQNLRKPFSAEFVVPRPSVAGPYKTVIRLSSVGWDTDQDVAVMVNGEAVNYEGVFTEDRSFFDVRPMDFTPGRQKIEIQEMNKDGNNVLAFAQIIAEPADMDRTPDRLAAFATFNDGGRFVGYRPTNDSCIMRNMRLDHFCMPDRENFWIQFLNRVSIIDDVVVNGANKQVLLKTPPLVGLQVQWFKVDQGLETEIEELRNQWNWDAGDAAGDYAVKVEFKTPEVRNPNSRFAMKKKFRI